MRKDYFTPKVQKDCNRFTKQYKAWVKWKIANSDMTSIVQVCEFIMEYMNESLPRPITDSQTIRNEYYGRSYPVKPERVILLSELTGIEEKLMHPMFK